MHLRDVSEGREINAWRVCRLLSVESIFCELFYLNISLQILCFLIWASTQKECVCVFFMFLLLGAQKLQKQISNFNCAICYVKYSLKQSHPSQNLEYEVSWDDKPVLKLSCLSLCGFRDRSQTLVRGPLKFLTLVRGRALKKIPQIFQWKLSLHAFLQDWHIFMAKRGPWNFLRSEGGPKKILW